MIDEDFSRRGFLSSLLTLAGFSIVKPAPASSFDFPFDPTACTVCTDISVDLARAYWRSCTCFS